MYKVPLLLNAPKTNNIRVKNNLNYSARTKSRNTSIGSEVNLDLNINAALEVLRTSREETETSL